MPMACKVCNHPQRLKIDREIVQGKSLAGISKRYGVPWNSLDSHKSNHLSRQLVQAYEKKELVVLIELENVVIQKVHKVIGPEVKQKFHSKKFLEAHKRKAAGPRIEDGRWIVESERKFWDAKEFLKHYLKRVKREARSGLKVAMNKKYRVIGEKEMIELYKKNKEFQDFFTIYLEGKEEFLNY